LNVAVIDYGMLKYEPQVLAAAALYLAQAIERKSSQKKSHQNSTHSLGHTHMAMNTRDSSSLDMSINVLMKVCQETDKSESEIKRCAIDINMQSKAKP